MVCFNEIESRVIVDHFFATFLGLVILLLIFSGMAGMSYGLVISTRARDAGAALQVSPDRGIY